MSRTKRLLLGLGAAGLLALGVSGCSAQGTDTGDTQGPNIHGVFYQKIPNSGGKQVLCVWTKNGYSGGVSCDFTSLHEAN